MSRYPYMLGVWHGSLIDVALFSNHFQCADQIIQIIPDANPRGYWTVLCVTGDQAKSIRDHGARQTPRWSFLP